MSQDYNKGYSEIKYLNFIDREEYIYSNPLHGRLERTTLNVALFYCFELYEHLIHNVHEALPVRKMNVAQIINSKELREELLINRQFEFDNNLIEFIAETKHLFTLLIERRDGASTCHKFANLCLNEKYNAIDENDLDELSNIFAHFLDSVDYVVTGFDYQANGFTAQDFNCLCFKARYDLVFLGLQLLEQLKVRDIEQVRRLAVTLSLFAQYLVRNLQELEVQQVLDNEAIATNQPHIDMVEDCWAIYHVAREFLDGSKETSNPNKNKKKVHS